MHIKSIHIIPLFFFLNLALFAQLNPEDSIKYANFKKEKLYKNKAVYFLSIRKKTAIKTEQQWILYFKNELKKYKKNTEDVTYINYILAKLYSDSEQYKESNKIANYLLENKQDFYSESLTCDLLYLLGNNYEKEADIQNLLEIIKQKTKYCNVEMYQFYRLYSKMGLPKRALKSYRVYINSLDQTKQTKYNWAQHTNNIGFYFQKDNQIDSAFYYYNKALDLILDYKKEAPYKKNSKREKEVLFWVGLIKGNIGDCYKKYGNYKKAITFLNEEQKSAKIFYKGSSSKWYGEKYYWEQVADCYLKLKNYKLAKIYIDSLFIYNDRLKYYNLKKQYYKGLKVTDSVNLYTELYNKINDSVITNKKLDLNKTLINFLDLEFSIIEKLHEIKAIKSENINTKKQLHLYVALFSLAIVTVLILVYFFYQKKKQTKIISSQKNIIESNLEEKNILLKELQHRVKNNLQTIKSLLTMRLKSIKSEKAKETIQHSINRIAVLSKIHHKLYDNNNNLNTIHLDEYINEIVLDLKTFYDQNKNVEFKLNIQENIFIHIDQTVTIGLIINELVTNSYKYAFINKDKNNIIAIFFTRNNDKLFFKYTDNGVGFDVNKKTKSMGIYLIKRLINQLGSDAKFASSSNGMEVSFDFIDKSSY
ncbi:sensor histidine kinase [Tenacibaculum sp. UWU-22]|uniref:sensor histidine kinase n=1 Tax=Tenacibaculum sp. UWU-22 TaxID=3234187 RepID=UPI0034DAC697